MIYKFIDKYIDNHFIDEISHILSKKKDDNLIIFDVGSFLGNFSRKIKNKIHSKKVDFYLFDPNKNLEVKDFSYFKFAFSNNQGTQDYYLNDFFPSGGSSLKTIVRDDALWNWTRKLITFNFNNKHFSTHKVDTDTIDNFCNIKNINKIDVLKIDVEGNELEVLLGAEETLHNIFLIQIEVLENKKNFDKKFSQIKYLLENKYGFKMINNKKMWTLDILSKMKAIDALFIKDIK
mgnify:CR=1 FL=1|tara:strand:+ start:1015 stop:1716 length:702 start_codon:yes stop_codon:yes gene_type:complete